jgi:hypothetical protein
MGLESRILFYLQGNIPMCDPSFRLKPVLICTRAYENAVGKYQLFFSPRDCLFNKFFKHLSAGHSTMDKRLVLFGFYRVLKSSLDSGAFAY